ncbi:hypothetical protein C8Q77DRAFT_195123 [Trametes polyzona]|nr:hypothetical protein C8Q77DRAFT_195123 [Trametes polyzona]
MSFIHAPSSKFLRSVGSKLNLSSSLNSCHIRGLLCSAGPVRHSGLCDQKKRRISPGIGIVDVGVRRSTPQSAFSTSTRHLECMVLSHTGCQPIGQRRTVGFRSVVARTRTWSSSREWFERCINRSRRLVLGQRCQRRWWGWRSGTSFVPISALLSPQSAGHCTEWLVEVTATLIMKPCNCTDHAVVILQRLLMLPYNGRTNVLRMSPR